MIVVAGEVKIRPDAREDAVRAAQRMAAATRAEAGCLAYRFSFDLADPALIYIFEEWESEDALAHHFQTPHMAQFRAAMPSLLAAPPSVKRYVVESVSPMS